MYGDRRRTRLVMYKILYTKKDKKRLKEQKSIAKMLGVVLKKAQDSE